ncbi:cell wall protein DAN4-like [Alosa sapidissima]|uniref:cell wall protein DAN4-like n=1 Tax=Alosa sapidissima TaxID=34773 RepID=UPI001C08FAFC|nr:cell wall protein DAN4-like [Alosa sapidissima]
MGYLALYTCLLLFVIECALSDVTPTILSVSGNTTDTNSSLPTAGVNMSTQYVSNSGDGSNNTTTVHETGTVTTTAQVNTTTCPTNNAGPGIPGATSRSTTATTQPMSRNTTHSTNMTSVSTNHSSTYKPGIEKPLHSGTAAWLGFLNTVLGAVLFVLLCNQ